jgi:hypothetical protein
LRANAKKRQAGEFHIFFLRLISDVPFLFDLLFSLYVISDPGLDYGKVISPNCASTYSCVQWPIIVPLLTSKWKMVPSTAGDRLIFSFPVFVKDAFEHL